MDSCDNFKLWWKKEKSSFYAFTILKSVYCKAIKVTMEFNFHIFFLLQHLH